jgi:Mor family transcriptional regulator
MGYRKAEQVLPLELIQLIQNYVDGECLYIPRKSEERRSWGEQTMIRKELKERNIQIAKDHKGGMCVKELAVKYYLSEKSIQRILRET